MQQGVPFPQAVANHKDKLVKSNVPYIKSEKVKSYEFGYKGLLGKGCWLMSIIITANTPIS